MDNIEDALDAQDTVVVDKQEQKGGSKEMDPLNTNEVKTAADEYSHYTKKIRSLAKNMKAGSLARVMIAEAEFPFAQEYPKLKGSEQELFVLLIANNKAKSVVATALKDQQADLEKEAANLETNRIVRKGGL